MKLLVMTDLHLTVPPKRIIGLDPAERFAQGLAHAARAHGDAERLILMGDLTYDGQAQEYARLAALLQGAPWPVSYLMGNHDLRAPFRAAFPAAPVDRNGFVQSVVDLQDVRLILLDTLEEEGVPQHAGRLCPARLDWLAQALAGAQGRPCLVFLHHPPFETGFSGMDGIGLLNAAELRRVLREGPVVHVFAGHIHRTITATVEGLPITVFKSPCHQMPLWLGRPGFGHSIDEPGAYGILLTRGPEVVVHFEDFTLPERQVGAF